MIIEKKWPLIKAAQLVTIEYQDETIESTVEKLIERIDEIEKKLGIQQSL